MNDEQGMIVLANFFYSNQQEAKIRPALIVSGNNFNQQQDVIAVSISTQGEAHRFKVLLETHDLTAGNLFKTSYVKCGQMLTLEKRLVSSQIGRITKKKLKEVLEMIRKVFEDYIFV